jgi:hypothetical protein
MGEHKWQCFTAPNEWKTEQVTVTIADPDPRREDLMTKGADLGNLLYGMSAYIDEPPSHCEPKPESDSAD